jgi:hypothetical protein
MKIKKGNFSLIVLSFVFGLMGLVFLYFVGNSQLEEVFPSFQFFADSNTYIKTYRGEGDEGAFVRVDGNYLGPLAILNIFQGNNYLIMIFNVLIFACSVAQIAKLLKLNSFYITILLLVSPLTISNLLSVNKEVFLFPFLALALSAYLRKSLMLCLLALSISVLVRWQLTVFYIVLLLIIIGRRSELLTRFNLLLLMLAALSIAYVVISPIIQPVLAYVQLSIDDYQDGGSGLFERVLELQNGGYYIFVFPIKALHLLFGMGLQFDKIFSPVNLYNDFFVAGHCAVTLMAFTFLAFKGKISLKSDLLFVSAIFLTVFCVTPIFAPRYLYFVFVLGVLVLAGAPVDLQRLQIQTGAKRVLRQNFKDSPA